MANKKIILRTEKTGEKTEMVLFNRCSSCPDDKRWTKVIMEGFHFKEWNHKFTKKDERLLKQKLKNLEV